MGISALLQQNAPHSVMDAAFIQKLSFAPMTPREWRGENLPERVTPHRLVFVDGRVDSALSCLAHPPVGLGLEAKETAITLRVEAQACLALDALEILYVWNEGAIAAEAATTLHLHLGENARLTLIERHLAPKAGEKVAHAAATQIHLSAQSKLVHGVVQSGGKTLCRHQQSTAHVAAGAYYDHFALVHDGVLSRHVAEVVLDGALAETRMQSLVSLSGEARADMFLSVRHETPHGLSRQTVKTVLDDKAKASFHGQVFVAKDAQKTDGHQLSRALLLSDKAEMRAKPELEIFADDVKCSHGSTVGDLDEQALFYLRSRGIPMKEARDILVHAFMDEVIDQLGCDALADMARETLKGTRSP